MKKFEMKHLLVVYTGISFEEHGIDAVYELLNHMTGESLSTLQLLHSTKEARPYLREQFPWLVDAASYVETELAKGKDRWRKILKHCIDTWGNDFTVRPMHHEDHEHKSEVEILREIKFKGEIITVEINDDDEPPISPVGDINWKPDDED